MAKINETKIEGNYAFVNGLNIYYEIHGSGEPLILLHGGVSAGEVFDPILSKLAENRKSLPSIYRPTDGRQT